MEFRNGFF